MAQVQKEDYQQSRQPEIDGYLSLAKQILPKYPQDSDAKKMLEDIYDLEAYFKTKK